MIWLGLFTIVNILPLISGLCEEISFPNLVVTYDSPKLSLSNDYPWGTVATFSCNNGNPLIGSNSSTCKYTWGYIPTCQTATCPSPRLGVPTSSHYSAAVSYNKYRVGGIVYLTCLPGYQLSGPSTMTCLESGNWNYQGIVSCNPVPTPPPPPPTTTTAAAPSGGGPGCFPSTARVTLENGKSVTMSELQMGDKIQTVSSTGTVTYSEVRAFLKKQPKIMIQSRSIKTTNETLTLTGNHLLYAREKFAVKFNPIYADQLSIGDEVLIQGNNELIPVKVNNVSSIAMQGAYVPLTRNGKIIVDGMLTSCYADFDHDMAHLATTPMQTFAEVMEWIFGNDLGFPVYVGTARQLGQLIMPAGQYLSY